MPVADVLVLGGGPAGYTAALAAARRGAKPVLVDRGPLGGACLHVGCIPTKTMLAGAEVWRKLEHGISYGLAAGPHPRELSGLMARRRAVVALLADQLDRSVRAGGVAIVRGEGRLIAPDRVGVTDTSGTGVTYDARTVILATGSRPRLLPGVKLVPGRIMTSDELVAAETWPASLLVIGGGVVGVEFASLLAAAGAKVTILEALPSLLPGEDAEVGRRLGAMLAASGLDIRVGEGLRSLMADATGVHAVTDKGGMLEAEAALIAVGRAPRLDGVDPAVLGIAMERGAPRVDASLQTTVETIWAAGDVAGGPQLAHWAAAQGRLAAASALGAHETLDMNTVPRCVYSIPEVASVGLTEEQAKTQRMPVRKGKALLRGNGRAQSVNEGDGFVKVLAAEETGEIVGVHAIGHAASEIISEAALAVSLQLTARKILDVIHPHPTIAEAFQEACGQIA